jgi:hypothetical protein
MHTKEEHVLVLGKKIVCTVAVVNVPIDDGHTSQAMLSLEVPRSHPNIVEKAETRGPIRVCVMTRRPDDSHAAIRRLITIVENRVD